MKAGIVARIKAGLTQDDLSLPLPAIMGKNPSPDRASIGFNSLEFDLNPVLFSLKIIAQKGRILIQIYDEHVDVAVIIKVPERAPAATVRLGNSRPSRFDQLLESVIPQIAKNRARRLVCVLREGSFNFRVDVACDHKQIRVAVIVEINNSSAPADITRFHANAR